MRDRRRRRRVVAWVFVAVALAAVGIGGWIVVTPMGELDVTGTATADPRRLERDVRAIVALGPRDYLHSENLAKVADYVARELAAAGGVVERQRFSVDGRDFENVIARFGPEAGPRVVVGAHYDTCGPLPGADDNASGVAGVLELARALGRTPPSGRVDLVAWPNEEPPYFRTAHMGSAVHARAMRDGNVDVRAMISVEMIGEFSDAPGSQRYPSSLLKLVYPSTGSFIAVISGFGKKHGGSLVRPVKRAMRGASSLPVRSLAGPRFLPGIDFSDHASFWDAGYPALMVTDTAFYRNERYHTAEDTPERLDYRRMAQVVDGLEAAARALAGGR
jgi:hypothetical protein